MMIESSKVSEHVELSLLDYSPSSLQEQLICPICHLVLTDPYSTVCGHTFCKECIYSIRDSMSSDQIFRCPVDRHPLTGKEDVTPAAYLVTSLLNELPVYCPFQNRGCTFEGKRWVIESHAYKDCDYIKVPCPGCSKPIQRRYTKILNEEDITTTNNDDITNSDEQDGLEGDDYEEDDGESVKKSLCVHVKISCPKECGDRFSRYKLSEHLENDCVNVKVQCEACDGEFSKPDLAEHVKTCPQIIINCDAAQYGCTWTGTRDEYSASHARNCTLTQLSPILSRQDKKMESLERDNKVLRFHVERLTNLANNNNNDDGQTRRRSSSSSDNNNLPSSFSDSDLLHMFMECERLRKDVDRLTTTLGDLEVKQGMMIMRENYRTGEEIANLRAGFNGLRHQLHFLLAERRSMASLVTSRYNNNNNPGGGNGAGPSSTGGSAHSTRPLSELFQGVKL